jgi:Carboxypeptidase regulatory-like domain
MKWTFIIALVMPLWAQTPACTLEGRVTNLISGGPVRKAKVLLGSRNVPKYQAVTDNDGHYAIAGIAPGTYTLQVQRPNFLPVFYGAHGPNRPGKSLVLASGENRKSVDFHLEPPGVITGHIYDQDGEILSTGVRLYRVEWRNGRKVFTQAGGANADDEGQYRLFGLAAGSYIVSTIERAVRPASPVPTREIYAATLYPGTDDPAGATVLKLAAGGEARNIDFQVRKTVSVNLSGTLVTEAPDPGTRLTLSRPDGFPMQPVQFLFPQHLQFTGRNVLPGSYVITARSQTEYARTPVEVGTLDVEGIQVRAAPLLEVSGSVKIEGDDAPDLRTLSFNLTGPEATDPPAMAHADEKGALAWKGLTPGTWTLHFAPQPAGLYLKSPETIDVGPEGHGPVEVVLSTLGAHVEGKVQASADHPDAVEGATVLLVADGTKPVRILRQAVTDVAGKYSFSSVPPGNYRVLALEDIENNAWENPSVAETFGGKGLAMELKPGEQATHDLVLTQP